jgi:hypothetical protein
VRKCTSLSKRERKQMESSSSECKFVYNNIDVFTLQILQRKLFFVSLYASMPISTPPKTEQDHCSHQLFNEAVRSMHMRRNAPHPILISINPIRTEVDIATPEPRILPSVAVELSNYPPGLSGHDVQELFTGFVISRNFVLPTATRFLFPFRTFIWITGEGEAKRAVKELSGRIMGGQQIRIVLVDSASYEQKEVVVAELADELKIAIISMCIEFKRSWV